MQVTFDELEMADDAARAEYLAAWNGAWVEFAMNDAELQLEVAVGGPARRWIVRGSEEQGSREPVGAVAVERTPWNGDDVPPIAMLALSAAASSPATCELLLEPCAAFAEAEGFQELRVMAWEREYVIVEQLTALPGWREVDRDIDVGLDLAGATGWQREMPQGYVLATLAERPDLERAVYDCLADVLPDIPGDEVATPIPWDDYSTWRRSDACRDEACFIALDGAGSIAGFAELEFPAMLEREAWHGFTAVARDHRGIGLAFALKSATIEWAMAAGFARLRTENEERNAPMRHINAAFGYAPLAHRVILRGPTAPLLRR